NYLSLKRGETGLEAILAKWGVQVTDNVIKDPENSSMGSDVVVRRFSNHPLVNPLLDSALHLILPRAVGRLNARAQAADAPHVDELAFSGPKSFVVHNQGPAPKSYP